MGIFRSKKLRYLYLLALIQLVGGPLVLLHVTVFCKLTLNEAPNIGIAAAVVESWQSEDFQTVLAEDFSPGKQSRKEGEKPSSKKDLEKQTPTSWDTPKSPLAAHSQSQTVTERIVTWTPRWPNAPPGPPPRLV